MGFCALTSSAYRIYSRMEGRAISTSFYLLDIAVLAVFIRLYLLLKRKQNS